MAVMLMVGVGCEKDNESDEMTSTDIPTQINNFPFETLNMDEINSLKFMREEEYLAYDVYLTLFEKWGISIFDNISESELKHTNAVLTLLNKYDIEDPASIHEVGIYADTTLQNLYAQLVTQGNVSLFEAFKVGATIEDLDIFDLNTWLTKVDNQDVIFVYENLNKGSRNHLRSFYGQISNSGGTYTAQFIMQNELEAIINSPAETGAW